MSIGKDENNQVHKSNIGFNPDVVERIRLAKGTTRVNDFMNALSEGITANQLSHETDRERINHRAKWAKEEEIGQEER